MKTNHCRGDAVGPAGEALPGHTHTHTHTHVHLLREPHLGYYHHIIFLITWCFYCISFLRLVFYAETNVRRGVRGRPRCTGLICFAPFCFEVGKKTKACI